ncbi:hypothetical protein [Aliarcobacter butzleri]|uniref:hypothetical protein n=1 Tax=Aliarcobacter butzleri TaxID=28197 RepID=UPI002B24BA23|nr:hypothetical protein [Aliarcobacter butzleri]
MGSNGKIYLGYITSSISHFIRNTFQKDVFITSLTAKKIKKKHPPLDKEFIYNHNFQIIIDNTIMIYFDEKDMAYNCLSKVDDNLLIYGIISKNNRTEVTTLFKTNPSQIKKKFLKNEKLMVLKKEEFTTN